MRHISQVPMQPSFSVSHAHLLGLGFAAIHAAMSIYLWYCSL